MRCRVCGRDDSLGNFLVCYTGRDGEFDCEHLDELDLANVAEVREIEHEDDAANCLRAWKPTIDELKQAKSVSM